MPHPEDQAKFVCLNTVLLLYSSFSALGKKVFGYA